MRTLLAILFLAAHVVIPAPSMAATTTNLFHVDFDAGNDALAGTNQATAWRTIPGSRNSGDTGYLNAAWGAITSSARIPDNSVIKIKGGTVYDNSEGNYVWLTGASGGFWDFGCTNITIETDQTWGTGTLSTIDAAGMSAGIAAILKQIDGVTLRNIAIVNSPVNGIQDKEKAGSGAPITNSNFISLLLTNNGTSFATDTAGAGSAHINIRAGQNVVVSNCLINGNQRYINGILFGDTGKRVGNGIAVGNTVTNLKGDLAGNDTGVGCKAFNGAITVLSNNLSFNLKGCDMGEQTGTTANPDGSIATILYKVIGNTMTDNQWGCNFNGPAGNYSASILFYAINNVITNNGVSGLNVYSAPHEACVVHNLIIRNGFNSTWASAKFNNGQIITTANGASDTNRIRFHCYNNIIRDQLAGPGNTNTPVFQNKRLYLTNDYTLDADYNYYEQGSSNTMFAIIGSSGALTATFTFGANGPGNASGNWFDWYATSTSPLTHAGIGHFHADAHSRGTGAADTTPPPFDASLQLTNSYPGSNLSTQSWYIAEMGIDRNGVVRTSWDLGVAEFVSGGSSVSAIVAPVISRGGKAVGGYP